MRHLPLLPWQRCHFLKLNYWKHRPRRKNTYKLKSCGHHSQKKKCKFSTKEVKYLWHITKHGRLEIEHALTAFLKASLPPKNKSEPRSSLGLSNAYYRFVDRFVYNASSLHILLQEHSPKKFTLNEKQLQAFWHLIDIFLFSPALTLLRLGLKILVSIDALAKILGCFLHQATLDGDRRNELSYTGSDNLCLRRITTKLRNENALRLSGRSSPSALTFSMRNSSPIQTTTCNGF